MTLEEALAFAVQRHQAGDLDQAEPIYDLVLERHPDAARRARLFSASSPPAWRSRRRAAMMRRVLSRRPRPTASGTTSATCCWRSGATRRPPRPSRAASSSWSPQVWSNLARAWRRRGALERANSACRNALAMDPTMGRPAQPRAVAARPAPGRGGRRRRVEGDAAAAAHEQRRSSTCACCWWPASREHAAVILRAWQAQDPDSPYVRAPAGGLHRRGHARTRQRRLRGDAVRQLRRRPSTTSWRACSTARRNASWRRSPPCCRRPRGNSTSPTSAAAPACAAAAAAVGAPARRLRPVRPR